MMFGTNPAKVSNVDVESIRVAIIAELDAANFYEQLAAVCTHDDVRKVLLSIANEEKVHAGELQALLERYDYYWGEAIRKGKDEVDEIREKGITGRLR